MTEAERLAELDRVWAERYGTTRPHTERAAEPTRAGGASATPPPREDRR